ncbi:hypothetical protein G6F42_028542 [Rhizopus arrhizus]|nr:hypothetical protein G6F42_028542 [Rhizopus arrhizus]
MAIMFENRVPLLPYWLAQIDDDRKLLPILPSQAPSVSVKKPAKLQQQNQHQHVNEETSLLSGRQQTSNYLGVPSTISTTPSLGAEEEEPSIAQNHDNIWQKFAQFPDQFGRFLRGHRGDDHQQGQLHLLRLSPRYSLLMNVRISHG